MIGSQGLLDKLPQIDRDIRRQDKEDEHGRMDQDVVQFASYRNKRFSDGLEKAFARPIGDQLDENFMADITRIAQSKVRERCRDFAHDEDTAITLLSEW
jgi:hypothetical protein